MAAQEPKVYGTLHHSGADRSGMTLVEARERVALDREKGYVTEVVLFDANGFIDDNFVDDIETMHDHTSVLARRLTAVQAVIDTHSVTYTSEHDNAYASNGICEICETPFPCDTSIALERAIRLN